MIDCSMSDSLSVTIAALPDAERAATIRRLLETDGFTCATAPLTGNLPGDESIDAGVVFDDGTDPSLRSVATLRRRGAAVFVLADVATRERFARLMAAGATGVLPPDVSDERIVAELQALADLRREASAQAIHQTLQPFLAATIEAWQLMAQVKARLSGVRQKREYRMAGEMTALIYLIGTPPRVLALSVERDVAKALSIRVLNGAIPDPDPEIVQDTLAEMANVVAGQVKGRYENSPGEFDISTPTVITGTPHHIVHRPDLPCYEMAFTSDVGAFHLQLSVRGREPGKPATEQFRA